MKYFGTDGIRGILGIDYDSIFLYRLGRAIYHLGVNRCVIGCDTRISKDLYSSLVLSGLLSVGIECYNAGVVTTPALINYSKNHNMIGVMITASHNPYKYNGIKIIKCGKKLSVEEEELISEKIDNYDDFIVYGSLSNIDILNEYYSMLDKYSNRSKLNVLIDCANGSASDVAVRVFSGVCNRVDIINDNPSGLNINNNCGSTNINNLVRYVKLGEYDLGLAFDGDADRLIACSKYGKIFDGDMLIYIFAKYLNIDSVVLSIMSNIGIIEGLKKIGVKVLEANVGDKYVYKMMCDNDIILGGEASGHIINRSINECGDGILNALILINLVDKYNLDLDEIYNEFNLYQSLSYNLNIKDINPLVYEKIEEIKKELESCKIVLRKSGTEEVVRLMVMCKRLDLCLKYIEELKKILISKD